MPSLRVDFFRPFRSALTLVFFVQRRHVEFFQLFLASYCGFAGFQGEAKIINLFSKTHDFIKKYKFVNKRERLILEKNISAGLL